MFLFWLLGILTFSSLSPVNIYVLSSGFTVQIMYLEVPIKITTASASWIHHLPNPLVRTLYLLYFSIFVYPLTFCLGLQSSSSSPGIFLVNASVMVSTILLACLRAAARQYYCTVCVCHFKITRALGFSEWCDQTVIIHHCKQYGFEVRGLLWYKSHVEHTMTNTFALLTQKIEICL